ncbi:MAG: polyprenyl synthetase family protein [Candidatus Omnitrophica bacterium]|nr:polyprenyl synthetase family protein [Candidatus Omnitrophota bacterium]
MQSRVPLLDLEVIYEPISQALARTEEVITRELAADGEYAGEVAKALIQGKGKRLRPALLLFSAQADRFPSEASYVAAAAMEMIHVATLAHDDVIDEAALRRDEKTVNSVLGNKIAILLGDFLYAKASSMLSSLEDAKLLQWISDATTQMCLGEFTQAYLKETPNLSEAYYLKLIHKKTACLMAACCQSGAYLSRGSEREQELLYQFGLNFGMAFQIVDDYLDITGDEKILGKPCGLDLLRGKVTLPIVDLYHSAPEQKDFLERLYTAGIQDGEMQKLKNLLVESGSLERAMDRARGYMDTARENLEKLEERPARESLLMLADYVLLRQR